MIDFARTRYPLGEILVEKEQTCLLWWFSTSIMQKSQRMGIGYALYDMAQDRQLLETIRETVGGEISLLKTDQLFSLTSKTSLPLEEEARKEIALNPDFHPLDQKFGLSKIDGFQKLYIQSSLESLISEKKKVTLWMGLFSFLVLVVSTVTSIFLARKMVNPLKEITKKATQISEGHKDLLFENDGKHYWEFNQLSQAFNYMLTNLKDAEEQTRYKELLENVDDAVYMLDQKGKILEANEAAYSVLGYSPEVFFDLDLSAIVPEEDARFIIEQLGENSGGQNPRKINIETCHQTTAGDCIPVEIHSRAITYRGRNVILNVARDISKRIEAEIAVRESEERYRSVVENSHDGIMIIDESFHILYANNVLSQILGHPRSEIEGSDFRKYLGTESAGLTADQFLNNLKKEKQPFGDMYKVTRKDANERSVKISAIRIHDSSGKEKIVAQILDITDQLRTEQENKKLETQLNQAQKMEAVGTLAGGVAHDFNNILMAIQGHTSLMRLSMDSDHPFDQDVEGIENGVTSAANLTSQLLGFARKAKFTLMPTSLNKIVEKSCRMFTRTRKDIKVIQKCEKKIWMVEADPGQMEQVLLNLYLNAWHAMPDGGELYIQTENVTLSGDYCKPFEVPGGNYVNVSVTDTGIGMDSETTERIFEPFFTTKEVGEGTGLGLSSTYGIIKNHKGFIRVYSEKGHGTTFNISLPASNVKDLKGPDVKTELIRGRETILLVDDEEAPIRVEEMMLKELGYTVMTAKSGKEALAYYKENRGGLDLVALDMVMPEMSGRDTYDELKKIDPDVKVLLVSGYSLNKQVEELLEKGCNGFMQKPFDIVQLSHKLREVLDH